VGDTLGAPVEFMRRSEILQRFGPKGITSYAPAYGEIGRITDDTQMTLFAAEGLLRGWVRGVLKGITSYSSVISHAYLRWLQTQGEQPAFDINFGSGDIGWLFQQRGDLLRTEFGLQDGLADTTSWGDMAKRHNDFKIPDGVPANSGLCPNPRSRHRHAPR